MSTDVSMPSAAEKILKSLSTFSNLLNRTIGEVRTIDAEYQEKLSAAFGQQETARENLNRVQQTVSAEIETTRAEIEKIQAQIAVSSKDIQALMKLNVALGELEAYQRGLKWAAKAIADHLSPA